MAELCEHAWIASTRKHCSGPPMQAQNGDAAGQLSAAGVFQCLQQALKADQQARQSAESQLTAWQERAGYCSCLLVRPLVTQEAEQLQLLTNLYPMPGMHRPSCKAGRTTVPDGWH